MTPSISIDELNALEQRMKRLKADCDDHHAAIEEATLEVAKEIRALKDRLRGKS